jgi:hypothetical protein
MKMLPPRLRHKQVIKTRSSGLYKDKLLSGGTISSTISNGEKKYQAVNNPLEITSVERQNS